MTKIKSEQNTSWSFANFFSAANRGKLFDILIFFANLYLMRILTSLFLTIFRQAVDGDRAASILLSLFLIGMFILPALGATLKRWRFHQRAKASEKPKSTSALGCVSVCLFNPLVYFSLNFCIALYAVVIILDQVSHSAGRNLADDGAVFLPLVFAAFGLSVFQTYFSYRYLNPPEGKPLTNFFLQPQSELLGDICLFVHMILFQVVWNMLTFGQMGRVSSVSEFLARLGGFTMLALFIYFPPRIFYLFEDINRPRTWLTMLLANSPVLFRILIGSGSGAKLGW